MGKPNILIFYCDDLGYGDVGFNGAEDVKTPHLDRLAASGVCFTQWYSNSPVCSPSRASLLTGRVPHRCGVPDNTEGRGFPGLPEDELTLAQLLKKDGYKTGLCGKWHLGSTPESTPNAKGFDSFYGFHGGCVDYYSHLFVWGADVPLHDLWRNEEEIYENGQYLMHSITREALDFLDKNQDDPFFLYVAFNAPHYPMHAPPEYFERFAHLPEPRRTQAAMVATIDDAVGAIIGKLEALGLRENTVVYFQSDHGPSNERRNFLRQETDEIYTGGSTGGLRAHKASLFEGGIRVPSLMSWPGQIPAGQRCNEVGVAVDILPTMLNIAGVPLPQDRVLDGVDILPMAKGQAGSPHGDLFWGFKNQRAVRRGPWKLVLHPMLDFERFADDDIFLANMEDDPGETQNLAGLRPEIVQELTEAIQNWERDVNLRD